MLSNITLGQFFPGNSLLHRLDPRVKIILVFIYITALFMIKDYIGYLVIFVFSATFVVISAIPVKFILSGLKSILFLISVTAILNIFMTPGEDIAFRFYFIAATYSGLKIAALMVLRIFFLILGTTMLTYTTSPIALTDGIEMLLSPFKKFGMPAHELALMMTIALRFIPTLFEETEKIMKAQKARGADFESGNIIKRAKGMVPLLVPLFISAFRRADDLAIAMESRCYNGGINRTKMNELKMVNRDYYSIIIVLIISALATII